MPTFESRLVLAFESRRAKEIETLIATFGGRPMVAPAMRELPLESDATTVAFTQAIVDGDFDIVIFLTGVGVQALMDVVDHAGTRTAFLDALRGLHVVTRGPKPVAVLRDLRVPIWANAQEPNTWREIMRALDERSAECPLKDARVAVQEYGVSNDDLVQALAGRGATVTPVPVYQWALPEDLEPLEDACRMLIAGEIDVVLFTTGLQAVHLLQVADRLGLGDGVRASLNRTVVASIGPTTSEELHAQALDVDLEPSHPKMGVLVRETAEKARALVALKAASH